jgi:hypothetical protein
VCHSIETFTTAFKIAGSQCFLWKLNALLVYVHERVLQVVGLDALSLAPVAVREEVRRRREQQRRSEAVWEALMESSAAGGGTFVSTEVQCPTCGEKRAAVHNILSGGTYAQVSQHTYTSVAPAYTGRHVLVINIGHNKGLVMWW